MSKCCKCMKWLPHNWLCLKGISILFIVLFYVTLVLMIGNSVLIYKFSVHNAFMWYSIAIYTLGFLLTAICFLAVAKFAKALLKIKQAVAPCCCEEKAQKNEEKTSK